MGLTEGFSFTEINGLRRMLKNEKISIGKMASVVDLYKYGIADNPWDQLDEAALRSAPDDFRRRHSFVSFTREDLSETRATIEAFAAVEGLDGHGRAATIRFE